MRDTEQSVELDLLRSLCGTWSGTYRLWLEPGSLRTQCSSTCAVRPLLDGRVASLEYEWTDLDGPQLGVMLLGHSVEQQWEMAWFDTWHTSGSLMSCCGDESIDVRGSYGPPGNVWGWRTSIEVPSDHELVITAWNVTPDGTEALATEARYARSHVD